MRTASLYARVSTSDKGQDTEVQLRELREYCGRRGFTIAGEYVDVGSADRKIPGQNSPLDDRCGQAEI